MGAGGSRAAVDEAARELWASRPRRRADERKVAGVAAAVGRRYRVDPVLVRVAFVVATIYGGAGILLYLLGWLLLPAEGDEASAAEGLVGRGRSSVSTHVTVGLGIALVPASGIVFDGDPSGPVGLALAGAALYLLHRHRAALGERPAPVAVAAPVATVPVGTAPVGAPVGTAPVGAPGPVGTAPAPVATPPSWDPLGAAPFAWDLPEPPPVPPPPVRRRTRSPLTPVTLGLALLTAGGTAAFVPSAQPAQIAGVALGVVGLGLLVGSLARGGRGLLAVALPLALVTWVLQALPAGTATVGERRWTAATAAELQPRYELGVGDARLDLRRLELPEGRTARTEVDLGLGEATVLLPRDLDVQLVCESGLGEVDCLGQTQGGTGSRVEVDDGGPDGGTLVLDVRVTTGAVAVTRG